VNDGRCPVTRFFQPALTFPLGLTILPAATMVLGNVSVGQGLAHTGPTGGLSQNIDNIDTFLRGLGWSLINNQTAPPASTRIAGLARGRLYASTYRDGRIQVKSVSPPRVAVVQYAASAR